MTLGKIVKMVAWGWILFITFIVGFPPLAAWLLGQSLEVDYTQLLQLWAMLILPAVVLPPWGWNEKITRRFVSLITPKSVREYEMRKKKDE